MNQCDAKMSGGGPPDPLPVGTSEYESYVAIYRRFSVQHDCYTFYIHPCVSPVVI